MNKIAENLTKINQKIVKAAQKSNRDEKKIKLLAVTKTFSSEIIKKALNAKQFDFGESRVQELLQKKKELQEFKKINWHFIGKLQSNKIRKILPFIKMIHSVDSLKLAKDINRISQELNLKSKVLLQINQASEVNKNGFEPQKILTIFKILQNFKNLEICGLMTIPPFFINSQKAKKYFIDLRNLKNELQIKFRKKLPELSMGMSNDFEVAIEEGATIVRLGSIIFGER